MEARSFESVRPALLPFLTIACLAKMNRGFRLGGDGGARRADFYCLLNTRLDQLGPAETWVFWGVECREDF